MQPPSRLRSLLLAATLAGCATEAESASGRPVTAQDAADRHCDEATRALLAKVDERAAQGWPQSVDARRGPPAARIAIVNRTARFIDLEAWTARMTELIRARGTLVVVTSGADELDELERDRTRAVGGEEPARAVGGEEPAPSTAPPATVVLDCVISEERVATDEASRVDTTVRMTLRPASETQPFVVAISRFSAVRER